MSNMQPRGREDNLIGIESHIEALNELLSIGKTEEVHIIGIYGMGGIGKTTIAQALFRRISFSYEGSSFINNVREQSSSKNDICALQEKILKDVLGMHLKFQDPEEGANLLQARLCNKKVFLVLDDVDNMRQLEFLAASNNWFGAGSRIIITTRDERLLSDANAKYKPALLRMDQSLELFSRHAFRKNSPPKGYKELSERAIRYTGCLPLALKILGSFFHGRKAEVWESALDRLAKDPDHEVLETLKLSFDNLNGFEQKMLLDIAFFFKDQNVKDVTKILDSCGFYPVIGMSVLIEKSLITISKERLGMHDLIHEMCLQIVRETFPNSRLRNLEEVHEMVVKNEDHEVIEAIVVPNCLKQGCRSDVFKRMKSLRLLDVTGKFTCDEPSFLPNNLKWITWHHYPFSSLPVPHTSKLVGLKLTFTKIQHLWKGQKIMPNLKFLHLYGLDCLTSFPDVSEAPNIERLTLSRCVKLVEVHESVGFLKKLAYLQIGYCLKLKCLPSRIEIESLDTLELIECTSLKRIPEFSPCVVKLSSLDLSFCSKIQELPSSIRYLSNLSFLNLNRCESLEHIPSSICELKSIKHVSLHGCSKLQKWPDQFKSMIKLEELELGCMRSFNFRDLANLCSLRKLDLSLNQISEENFSRNLDGFFLLEELCLSGNSKLARLLATISHLSNLKQLELDDCDRIQNLNSLPLGLQVLSATNCILLERIEDLSNKYECLYKIHLYGCNKLLEDEQSRSNLDNMLKQSFLKKRGAVDRCLSICVPGSKIPSWFEEQHGPNISLKLSPKWHTEILGFAICGVFKILEDGLHAFMFRFVNNGMVIPKFVEADKTTSAAAENEIVLINYIPFTSFGPLHDDYIDFQFEDRSHITEGILSVDFSVYIRNALRSGVHVMYKKDVEFIQHVKPPVSSYCWNWRLVQGAGNHILCMY